MPAEEQEVTHTPGPWRISERTGTWAYIRAETGAIVGGTNFDHLFMDGVEESDANTRLFIAAPDLLEALKAAIPAIKHSCVGAGNYRPLQILEQAKAAIAKAMGK